MNRRDLFEKLAIAGIDVRVEDGRLRVEAPYGHLTTDLREALLEHKAALLAEGSAEGSDSVPCCRGGSVVPRCQSCRQCPVFWHHAGLDIDRLIVTPREATALETLRQVLVDTQLIGRAGVTDAPRDAPYRRVAPGPTVPPYGISTTAWARHHGSSESAMTDDAILCYAERRNCKLVDMFLVTGG